MSFILRTLSTASALTVAAAAFSVTFYGVDGNLNLVRFDSANPSGAVSVGAINVAAGERLVGLDFRSNGGALYALGASGNLYTLNTATGAVLTTTALSGASLSGDAFGVDFNPTVDRLRIVSNNGQNLRVNVDTGAVTVDTPLAYAAGDVNAGNAPSIVAAAYTNNQLGGPNPQTPTRTTALYDIDSNLDALIQQTNANGGVLETRAPLGENVGLFTDVDIFTDANGVNSGFLVFNSPASGSQFFSLAVSPTATSANALGLIGTLPNGVSLIAAQPVPEPMTLAALGLGAAAMLRRRRKN